VASKLYRFTKCLWRCCIGWSTVNWNIATGRQHINFIEIKYNQFKARSGS